jgi:hypothetical protein
MKDHEINASVKTQAAPAASRRYAPATSRSGKGDLSSKQSTVLYEAGSREGESSSLGLDRKFQTVQTQKEGGSLNIFQID